MDKIGKLLAGGLTLASCLWWLGAAICGGTFATGGYPYDCTKEFLGFCAFTNANRTIPGAFMVFALAAIVPAIFYILAGILFAVISQAAVDLICKYLAAEIQIKDRVTIMVLAGLFWPLSLVITLIVLAFREWAHWVKLWFELLLKRTEQE